MFISSLWIIFNYVEGGAGGRWWAWREDRQVDEVRGDCAKRGRNTTISFQTTARAQGIIVSFGRHVFRDMWLNNVKYGFSMCVCMSVWPSPLVSLIDYYYRLLNTSVFFFFSSSSFVLLNCVFCACSQWFRVSARAQFACLHLFRLRM